LRARTNQYHRGKEKETKSKCVQKNTEGGDLCIEAKCSNTKPPLQGETQRQWFQAQKFKNPAAYGKSDRGKKAVKAG